MCANEKNRVIQETYDQCGVRCQKNHTALDRQNTPAPTHPSSIFYPPTPIRQAAHGEPVSPPAPPCAPDASPAGPRAFPT